MLADLETAKNHAAKLKDQLEKKLMEKIIEGLNTGVPVRDINFASEELRWSGKYFS